jgi:hypothetical protein
MIVFYYSLRENTSNHSTTAQLPRDCIAWHLHLFLITTPLNNSEANKKNAIKIMKLIVAAHVNMQ